MRMESHGGPNPYTFVVGSARSGTTLLRRILDAHPQIAITPETHWAAALLVEARNPLCAFLALPYDDAMVRFHEGRTRNEPGLTPKKAWLPITPGLRNWRTEMPDEDVERFEAAAGELLDELGYERAFPRPRKELRERALALRARIKAEVQAKRQPVPAAW